MSGNVSDNASNSSPGTPIPNTSTSNNIFLSPATTVTNPTISQSDNIPLAMFSGGSLHGQHGQSNTNAELT